MKSYIFLADGFEEIEALATADVLRRAGIDVDLVSIYERADVVGAHGMVLSADILIEDVNFEDAEWLILPGGMPGASNLRACGTLCDALLKHNNRGGRIAAICAAPAVVLASLGLLEGRDATCYPGFEGAMTGANVKSDAVVKDANIITAFGPGAAVNFALAVVCEKCGQAVADGVAQGMLLDRL